MQAFGYERPTALADAISILGGAAAGEALPLAGGTDLVIALRDRSVRPSVVVDLKRIREWDTGIRVAEGRLSIGAGAVMTDIAAHPVVRRDYTALAESAAVVGAVQIRNRATLAGNICNASPAADTAPALLVYDAAVVVAGPKGERRIPIEAFFVRSGVTTLERGEVVTRIDLPLPAPGERRGSTHQRRTRRRGHDLASVTLACLVGGDGVATRVAFGSVGPRPYLAVDESGVLADPRSSEADRLAVLDRFFAPAAPSATSMRASPEYRLAMLRVLGLRAVAEAQARAGGSAA